MNTRAVSVSFNGTCDNINVATDSIELNSIENMFQLAYQSLYYEYNAMYNIDYYSPGQKRHVGLHTGKINMVLKSWH